ncbi:2-C-methyl-D-erythritol 4-phosphate cytidylyltransferase [Corynebacterium epidermidicanis]|uniref:2-C-methyl-D-erythritol 4-phosphate cytidylyltransferase n=1 Tax=Corynebacterium epidermidicanis TaxID=1050174 RepID=A0A0G3GWQ6_9CORY|nr:2-C-methyl-D-erythritol 4-phosphate cytidylyltransferase [Corynebacterium epidermidicanis]AKK03963.1 2-C-methyl-D-erythritol 4-phosphate cytidylyltransferase [Corynebacterium epidermidicanis]
MSRRVIALIAAAGKGTRLGAAVPKAFVPLRGRTLLERSMSAMITSGVVDEIIVLVSPDMETYARDLLSKRGLFDAPISVRLVHGGGERADSIWAGLQAIPEDNAVVLIHDAARALTPPGMIARVARAVLDGNPAAIPVVPVVDTIKRVAADVVVDTPDRASLRAVQTPQGFDLATLREVNQRYYAAPQDFLPTDDASLMEWAGHPVLVVQGDPMAFKVTTPMDMAIAQMITDDAEPTIFEVPSD